MPLQHHRELGIRRRRARKGLVKCGIGCPKAAKTSESFGRVLPLFGPEPNPILSGPEQNLNAGFLASEQFEVLESPTQQVLSVEPNLTKTTSTWTTSEFENAGLWYPNVTDNMLINLWGTWYQIIPSSQFLLDYSFSEESSGFASIGDVYLIQKLNMPAANHSDTQYISLHDFENALSMVVASMLWTRHVHLSSNPAMVQNFGSMPDSLANGTVLTSLNNVSVPIRLLPGKANITEIFTETQLELNIIARHYQCNVATTRKVESFQVESA
ncbi:hypothetical protein C8R45DRAFT_944820 [Mycena sanguinolenta]|nr:hypothetical protein C8R45DRAFT_944820 [Mycena sanguinolenta]